MCPTTYRKLVLKLLCAILFRMIWDKRGADLSMKNQEHESLLAEADHYRFHIME